MKRKNKFFASLVWMLAFFAAAPALPANIITGSAQRPFPAFMPLDYSRCRATAWLDALRNCSRKLPHFVSSRLREMNLEMNLGGPALCNLACTLIKTSPETSGAEIEVELEEASEMPQSLKAFLDDWQLLILSMALIDETRRHLDLIEKSWPESVADARKQMNIIESEASQLDGLWQLRACIKQNCDNIADIAQLTPDSAIAYLLLAKSRLQNKMPQSALEAAQEAVHIALRNLDQLPENDMLWQLVAARAYLIRSDIHQALGQTALADSDLDRAIELVEKSEDSDLLIELLHKRSGFAEKRDDREAMCADYQKACALGDCQGIARARRNGFCLDSSE